MILIDRRKELGYSQSKVAQLSGLPRTLIINLEVGNRKLSHLLFYQAAALCQALDISFEEYYNSVCCNQYQNWVIERMKSNV